MPRYRITPIKLDDEKPVVDSHVFTIGSLDDVLIVRTRHSITAELADRVMQRTQREFPRRKVLVFDAGFDLCEITEVPS